MAAIKFSDIKSKLQTALQAKLAATPIVGEMGFTIIDGFMTLPIHGEISNSVIIGGPSIPIVGIVGNTSGRVYTFALKVILPDITI